MGDRLAQMNADEGSGLTDGAHPTDVNNATASLSYTFDSMGRLNTMSVTDGTLNQQVISGVTYGPANEITSIAGATGGWGGESRTYNAIKQLTAISFQRRQHDLRSTGHGQ